MTSSTAAAAPQSATPALKPALILGALGVVFGDIGTSPIYALRQSLQAAGQVQDETTVLGTLSLVIWAITLVVAIKYVIFVMRADNDGEGGTMALISLVTPLAGRFKQTLLVIGLIGTALFFGDAMVTPAISVLSAVEGLKQAAPSVAAYVVPIAAGILLALFAIQSRGSARVGFLFGPVMAAWFATLVVVGVIYTVRDPRVLQAINPGYALAYVAHAGLGTSFAVLGSVFLALTGGEALYADMGHFGRPAIRIAWFAIVFPALILIYLGQGALVLGSADAAKDPFFNLFSGALLIPAVLLSTVATVIASQAVISGAFAVVQQAVQLGCMPRLDIRQTSDEAAGSVYIPQINWLLAAIVLALVFGFRSSDRLANAYGIAVSGNMAVTTLMVTVVALKGWRWPAVAVIPVAGLFLALDLVFVAANGHKVADGGWVPLLAGAIITTLMLVWRKGRGATLEKRDEDAERLDAFIAGLSANDAPVRTKGMAIYLTRETEQVPSALALNVKHNNVVHDRVILLKVSTEHVPRLPEDSRLEVKTLPEGFRLVWMKFGFAEQPDVAAALKRHEKDLDCDPDEATFFIGRETPAPSLRPDLGSWQEHIYAFMIRNAVGAAEYFLIPPPRVVELGTRVEM